MWLPWHNGCPIYKEPNMPWMVGIVLWRLSPKWGRGRRVWKQLKVEDMFVLIVVNVTNKCVVEKKWQELRLNSVPKGIFSGSLDEQCDQKNHAVPGHMQWNGDANVISCVCCLLCDSRSVLWITLPCCSCLPAPASTCLLTQTFLHKNTPEGRTTHKHTSDVSEQF